MCLMFFVDHYGDSLKLMFADRIEMVKIDVEICHHKESLFRRSVDRLWGHKFTRSVKCHGHE